MLDRLCLVAAFLLCLASACSELPTGPAKASRMATKGVTLADWSAAGYSTAEASAAVDRIFLAGANALTVIVTLYQDGLRADEPMTDPQRTPTPSSVADIVLKAKSLELQVSVKIHVDLYDGRWRGLIDPPDPSRWFEAYGRLLEPWTSLAETMGADQLVIGTELAGTVDEKALWLDLISRTRGVFSGELVYAASWDEARKVPFWSALDVVGVNFYAPVATRTNAHRFEILHEWQPWIERLQLLHKLTDRDVLISEIGYRSVDGAGMHPYTFQASAPVDLAEQADLYWAALEALGNKPWVRGVSWWNWLANGGATELTDYTPEGKPAQRELTDAWR